MAANLSRPTGQSDHIPAVPGEIAEPSNKRRQSADKSASRSRKATDKAILAGALLEAAPHMQASMPLQFSEQAKDGPHPSIAILIPCHNEAASIGRVISEFRAALPSARIIVFDNCSTDETTQIARQAGAEVHHEKRVGKGNVVRRMFADIDADIYVMADGDGTYDISASPHLVNMLTDQKLDMVVAQREHIYDEAHRYGHALGNKIFNKLYKMMFGPEFSDIFSGYRAFSRRFVKSFPAFSSGFEIETEMSVHASQLRLPTGELALPYVSRVDGSRSKLKTFRDGWRILSTFVFLMKETRPARFFGFFSFIFIILALVLAIPLIETWIETGLVPRLPTAILCTGLFLLSSVSMTCGLVLDSLARSRAEVKTMLYLAIGGNKNH